MRVSDYSDVMLVVTRTVAQLHDFDETVSCRENGIRMLLLKCCSYCRGFGDMEPANRVEISGDDSRVENGFNPIEFPILYGKVDQFKDILLRAPYL